MPKRHSQLSDSWRKHHSHSHTSLKSAGRIFNGSDSSLCSTNGLVTLRRRFNKWSWPVADGTLHETWNSFFCIRDDFNWLGAFCGHIEFAKPGRPVSVGATNECPPGLGQRLSFQWSNLSTMVRYLKDSFFALSKFKKKKSHAISLLKTDFFFLLVSRRLGCLARKAICMENGLDGGAVQAWIYSSPVFAKQLDALKTFLKDWIKSCVCVYNHIGLKIKSLTRIPNRVLLHTEAFTVWRFTIGNSPAADICWVRRGCSGRQGQVLPVKHQAVSWLSSTWICQFHLNAQVFTGPSWVFPTAPKCLLQIAIIGKIHDRLNFVKNPWPKSKLYPPKRTSNSLPELLHDQPFRSKLPTDKTLLGISATKADTKHSFNMVSEGSSLDVKRKNAFKQTSVKTQRSGQPCFPTARTWAKPHRFDSSVTLLLRRVVQNKTQWQSHVPKLFKKSSKLPRTSSRLLQIKRLQIKLTNHLQNSYQIISK